MPLSRKDPLIHYHISHTRTIKRSWVSAKFFGEHTRQQIKVVEYPEDSMQSLLQLHQTTHTVQLSKHNNTISNHRGTPVPQTAKMDWQK